MLKIALSAPVSAVAPRDAPHSASAAPPIAKPAPAVSTKACTWAAISSRMAGGIASVAIATPWWIVLGSSTSIASVTTNTSIGNSARIV